MLKQLIETYLREVGFDHDETGWSHRELGTRRSFTEALTWWIGVEYEKARAPGKKGTLPDHRRDFQLLRAQEILGELVAAVKRQYPDYRTSSSPEVVAAAQRAEEVLRLGSKAPV